MGSKASTKKKLKDSIGKPYICPNCNESFQSTTLVKDVKIYFKF